MATGFHHRRLVVFARARALYSEIRAGVLGAGWVDRPLALQLVRACASIALNIAEGAGEYSSREKARYYRMARRSAAECDSALELLETSDLLTPALRNKYAAELDELAAMLTRMIRNRERLP